MIKIHHCSAQELLHSIIDNNIDLVYIDPPYNTKKQQDVMGGGKIYGLI